MLRSVIPLASLLLLGWVGLYGAAPASAQPTDTAELTLESLFGSPAFYGQSFQSGRWAESGPVVRYIESDPETDATDLMEYNLETDTRIRLIDGSALEKPDGEGLLQIEDYAYSADRSRVLLYTDSERVWRLNTKGFYYVYDIGAGTLTPVSERGKGFQMFAKFNPAGDKVAFVRDRDLFVVDLGTGEETRLTDTGSPGGIINGTFDWVYEEEFGLRDGFRWSPDGQHIAFFQLDESATRDFQMTDFRTLYPEYVRFRYPKAGEVNSEIRVGVIDIPSGETAFFDTDTWNEGGEETEYLALMGWTPAVDGEHQVWMARLNRDQNDLDLLYGSPASMDARTVLEETSATYLDVETGFSDLDMGTITYLQDGEHFVWRSDRDGYSHLYLYENDGDFVRQLTSGDWDVTSFHGIDEDAGAIYVTGTRESPIERHFYRVPFGTDAGSNGQVSEPVKITERPGWHAVNTSADLGYYLDTYSNAGTPPATSLHTIDGTLVQTLEPNEALAERVAALDLASLEFLTVPGADGTPLNAYLIKPSDFDSDEEYPLLIHTYGGPGSQEVRNAWGGVERLWHYYLAEEHGILVAGIDNRGTGGRGKDFKAQTYKRLGPLEAEDQTAAAEWFGEQDWVDEDRLGIWGWSYGGYLSLLAMLYEEGPETFDLGIAVAPVTNWRFYDTIYTERYLSTPQRNPEGYDRGSPVTYAGNLEEDQDLLIVHGDFDDNVHVQNTIVMADALQAAGKQFDMMIYPGRNHGIYGGNTRLHLYTLLTDFITENL
jgi:dipeptidyl-peptidase-4